MKRTLSRGERFAEARTKYNPHGSQTMREVSVATGVSWSMISDLENDDIERSVGYDKVQALADHYSVSIDWLLGRSSDPHIQPTAVDELGLSTDSIDTLRHYNDNYSNAHLGLDLLLLYNDFNIICSKISRLCDMVQEFNLRVSPPEFPHAPDVMATGRTMVADAEKARTILAEIKQKYPEISGYVRLCIGFPAIEELKRDIADEFERILDIMAGYDVDEHE